MLVKRSGGVVDQDPDDNTDTASDFWKRTLAAYPTFEVNEDTHWKKEIHNYKLAIYNKTYEEYQAVWNLRDFGFKAIMIEVVDGKMEVEFTQAFLFDLESLHPDQVRKTVNDKRKIVK